MVFVREKTGDRIPDPSGEKGCSGLLVLAVLLFAFVATDAAAGALDDVESGQLLLGEAGQWQRALLLDTRIEGTVTGIVARITVTQRFRNTSSDWRNATYVFPLSETAAVNHMQMKVGDRVIVSRIEEKAQARRSFETARVNGQHAALTEQLRANLFSQSIANIPPGEVVEVSLTYVDVVTWDQPHFSLRLPLTLTPRYVPPHLATTGSMQRVSPPIARDQYPVVISLTLNMGLPVANITSAYHEVTIGDGPYPLIALKRGVMAMDRDFVLSWDVITGASPGAAVFRETVGDEEFALVLLQPPSIETTDMRIPRGVIFIIDTSGSMGGPSIVQAKLGLQSALSMLQGEDRFNIIRFSDTMGAAFDQLVAADPWHIDQASRWVDQLLCGGGTEMFLPLATALRMPGQSGHLKQILFITDGAVGNEAQLLELIRTGLGEARLYTVGIGAAPNGYFMRKAAQFGRGTFTQIGAIGEVADRMRSLYNKIELPLARDIQVRWYGSDGVDAFPQQPPDLYANMPLSIFVRAATLQGEIEISGSTGGIGWQRTLSLDTDGGVSGISTLWAGKKIDALMDERIAGRDADAVRREVIAVALAHQVVSPYTSLVAVEEWVSRPTGEAGVDTVVPSPAPAGQMVAWPRTATSSRLALCVGMLLLMCAFGSWRVARP